eukprot:GDKI01027820.1.p2 GENE.GDKI01027820.1~~GDKI01027820.1.p2  ORF type:complete len:160 (-),score=44.35 GDKI01027820.1:61-540(-)
MLARVYVRVATCPVAAEGRNLHLSGQVVLRVWMLCVCVCVLSVCFPCVHLSCSLCTNMCVWVYFRVCVCGFCMLCVYFSGRELDTSRTRDALPCVCVLCVHVVCVLCVYVVCVRCVCVVYGEGGMDQWYFSQGGGQFSSCGILGCVHACVFFCVVFFLL